MKKAILASLILINLYIPVIAEMQENFNESEPWEMNIDNPEATGGAAIWTISEDPFLAAEFYAPKPGHYKVSLNPIRPIGLGENPGTLTFSYSSFNIYYQGILWLQLGIPGEKDLPLVQAFRTNSSGWQTITVSLPEISEGSALELRGFILDTNPLNINPLGNRMWIDNIESHKSPLTAMQLLEGYTTAQRDWMEYLLVQRPTYQDLEDHGRYYSDFRTNFDTAQRIVTDLQFAEEYYRKERGEMYLKWYQYPPEAPLEKFLNLHKELKSLDQDTSTLELFILAMGKLIPPYLENRTPTIEERKIAEWAVKQDLIETYEESPLLNKLEPFIHKNIVSEKGNSYSWTEFSDEELWTLTWLPSGKTEDWNGNIDFSNAPENTEHAYLQAVEKKWFIHSIPPSKVWIDIESDQKINGLQIAFSDPLENLILYDTKWQIFQSELPQYSIINNINENENSQDEVLIESDYIRVGVKRAIILDQYLRIPSLKNSGAFSAGESLLYYRSEGDSNFWTGNRIYYRYNSIDDNNRQFLFQGIIIKVPEKQELLKLKINKIGID
jgi:hypothetical protein